MSMFDDLCVANAFREGYAEGRDETTKKLLEVFDCLDCPIHPNLRGDAEIRFVLPLGGEILHITVNDLRKIQETLLDMRLTGGGDEEFGVDACGECGGAGVIENDGPYSICDDCDGAGI